LAATSSCVESGLEAHSTTSAPPSRRQTARLAVSAVTCRQAEIRMPFSGWFLMNSLRMICRTFIDWFAQSIRFLPRSASSKFLMSQFTCADVVAITLLSAARFSVGASAQFHGQGSSYARPENQKKTTLKVLLADRMCGRFMKPGIAGQFRRLVRGFPGKVRIAASKVAIG